MKIYRGSWDINKMEDITFKELLEENKEFLESEGTKNINTELEKMMKDIHPLKFDNEVEQEEYLKKVNNYFK